jgi:hypothetical protein
MRNIDLFLIYSNKNFQKITLMSNNYGQMKNENPSKYNRIKEKVGGSL